MGSVGDQKAPGKAVDVDWDTSDHVKQYQTCVFWYPALSLGVSRGQLVLESSSLRRPFAGIVAGQGKFQCTGKC